MSTILIILILLLAIFLIFLVLIQPGKADMGATFGGLGSQMGTMFGSEKSKNILQTATKITAVAILVLVLVTNKFFVGNNNQEVQNKIVTEGQSATPMRQAPQAPAQQQAPAQGQEQGSEKQAQPATEQPKK